MKQSESIWASLVAPAVKNPPEMWETWVQSLGWEDPLEKGMVTHSSITVPSGDWYYHLHLGFPGSSGGKEPAYNAGDPGLIPGLGRSPGEGTGYLFQYSLFSLMAQTVKNPPAVWETWVWSLDWEDPQEGRMATHTSILAWRIPMDRGTCGVQYTGSQRVGHDWVT